MFKTQGGLEGVKFPDPVETEKEVEVTFMKPGQEVGDKREGCDFLGFPNELHRKAVFLCLFFLGLDITVVTGVAREVLEEEHVYRADSIIHISQTFWCGNKNTHLHFLYLILWQ